MKNFKSLAVLPWRMAFSYYMKTKITTQQKKDAYKWAQWMVMCGGAFNRYNKNLQHQIDKHYLGKLGEIAFYNIATREGIMMDYNDVINQQYLKNGDEYDFLMPYGDYKIDIKACKPWHRYLLVPKNQIDRNKNKKDIYVAIIVDEESGAAEIKGYTWKEDLIKNTDEAVSTSMPDGANYNAKLSNLKNISDILSYWYF
jgi:hypothetical protein